ncbi:DNA-binding response regulator [Pseudidiomarina aestuarii]|uniref:DNA-binding response regulator n=1 Tax=Pseudidiomarina aestuarii TaxID=624146 RepID=A0A2T4CUZ4_9GAMM|nr:DNA-binding response regulator [Pseudidiomarina aestuarii]PTB88530.1 DNA-binding response regulator [Pseudidiomarina aestuarii]PTB90286.1 DNA-binding response regulator [Pseudidiomarina aestuarii]
MRILLLEDHQSLAEGIIQGLGRMGYVVDHCLTLAQADAALSTDRFDLAIFDLGLPDGRSVSLIKQLRKAGNRLPVIVLTAFDDLESKLSALNEGANDYVVKPFELRELEARIRAQLRSQTQQVNDTVTCGELTVDLAAQQCRVGEQTIHLTRLEWLIMKQLALNLGKIVSKEQLESACYGWGGDNESNSLEVHLHHLRKKLPANTIHTARGLGYRLSESKP